MDEERKKDIEQQIIVVLADAREQGVNEAVLSKLLVLCREHPGILLVVDQRDLSTERCLAPGIAFFDGMRLKREFALFAPIEKTKSDKRKARTIDFKNDMRRKAMETKHEEVAGIGFHKKRDRQWGRSHTHRARY